jgi:hypothetical protein
MFDYWHRRGLVKTIRLSEISEQDESVLFAATSTKEEWKKQGDYFKKKKLWEPAMKCYVKAEETFLEMEARAYCMFQKARAQTLKPREMEELYLQAALAFLECDRSKHDLKSLKYAASFLKKAKRSNESGFLYAKLNRVGILYNLMFTDSYNHLILLFPVAKRCHKTIQKVKEFSGTCAFNGTRGSL